MAVPPTSPEAPRWGSGIRRVVAALLAGADVTEDAHGWRYVVMPSGGYAAHVSPRAWAEVQEAMRS